MSITVKVGEAKTHLSELLAKVEAGEDVIIQRGNLAIAKLSRIRRENDIDALIAEIKAQRVGRPVTTQAEIRDCVTKDGAKNDIRSRRVDRSRLVSAR